MKIRQRGSYDVRPTGHVDSTLTDSTQSGIRRRARWLHRSRRDELATHPQDDMSKPVLGVYLR